MKECFTCKKKINYTGKNCYNCARKIREENRKGRPCSVCKRTDILIYRQCDMLCVICWRNDKLKTDPDYLEKRKIWQRKRDRRLAGLPEDMPLKYAPRGSGTIDNNGYRVITKKGHANCKSKKGHIFEHTFVMSEYLGRALIKGEAVHHKNGIKHDNRIENLELWHKGQPAGQRVEDKIAWAKEFLEEYGYKIMIGGH